MEQWETDARWSYDTVAEAYLAATREAVVTDPYLGGVYRMLAGLASAAAAPHRPVISDVGCGPGLWVKHLCETGAAGIGIDVSPAMIRLAEGLGLPARFVEGSIMDIPLPEGACDGVACMYVMHHLPDDALVGAMDELVRITRPGGVLMVGGHAGIKRYVKTQGYGGLPMRVLFNRRPLAGWHEELLSRGCTIEADITFDPHSESSSFVLFARKAPVG